jgi:1-deoxy-D-xylulose-5-phosphate synthase
MARRHRLAITVEDNSRMGGVGSTIAQFLRDEGVRTPMREFGIPRRFLQHGSRAEVLSGCGLTAQDIARAVVEEISGPVEDRINTGSVDFQREMARLIEQERGGETR